QAWTPRGRNPASARQRKAAPPGRAARRAVRTDRAPRAIGPYSQAIVANGLVFCAGQIGADPATGELVAGGVREQAEQVLKNLAAVLEAAGSDADHVVKTTVFLADMNDFAAMNEIYARHFKTDPPARSTVQAARLPRGALIEIEAIAIVKTR
ncbi:MAG TPA: RidA family protein, partial [Pyrinomonadaceae bacterium]|nr:RidA family protein [Pyrinomonadaceae bacterium]